MAGADLSDSPDEVSPDRALVFEVIGPLSNVTKFIQAAQAAGFEWLGEDQEALSEDEEDEANRDDDAAAESLLYVTMPTLAGLNKILSLWKRFTQNKPKPDGADREWWPLFGYLSDIRTWSAKDRVEPSMREYVERMLAEYPDQPVRIELDLWFRADPTLRADARAYVGALMDALEGRLLDFATIEPIHYQAALVEVPGRQARLLQNLEGPIANADRLMRVRPQSLYRDEAPNPAAEITPDGGAPGGSAARTSIAALLDGYPVENHVRLSGRLQLAEVDVTAITVPVERRRHGTSMASLILHGDLAHSASPLDRPLTVVPILAAPQGLNEECTPPDKLPLALVHRAVLALMTGVDGEEAVNPDVVIINHSVCDREAPFAQRASYWAKLLDYLAFEYKLLFVVSAGNSNSPFEIDTYADCDAFDEADPVERQVVLLRAVERAKARRLILSPAETMNGLTVGALHADGSTGTPDGMIDPYDAASGVANITSSVGLGINRAIKPDVMEHGGRQLVRTDEEDGIVSAWAFEQASVGQLSALPDPFGGAADRVGRTTGTSNAAALVTRSAVQLADLVEDLFTDTGEDWNSAPTRAVVLKALLAHGCNWGKTGELLDSLYPGNWQRRREAITRSLGYGAVDLSRIVSADGSRITLLADDLIAHNNLHEYKLPIPRAMISNREIRRVVVTLAWSSPIDPVTRRYRGVLVEAVDGDGKRKFWDGVGGILGPTVFSGRRGTLQHMVLEGKKLMHPGGASDIFLGVQARADLKAFENVEVPYALAVTLELAQPLRQDLFADVEARVRKKVPVAPTQIPTRIRT